MYLGKLIIVVIGKEIPTFPFGSKTDAIYYINDIYIDYFVQQPAFSYVLTSIYSTNIYMVPVYEIILRQWACGKEKK